MDHSMGTSTMAMGGMTMTTAAAAATSSMSMDGMDMGGGCKISMLWNWYTVDACFLASSWHIRSAGMMAGSCIGVILLVMVLELLRRGAREYDAFLIRSRPTHNVGPAREGSNDSVNKATATASQSPIVAQNITPNVLEQAIRALFHTAQFAVAYIIMLLAMYFNGYIIISIFIGAFIGFFVFSWHRLASKSEQREVTFCCG